MSRALAPFAAAAALLLSGCEVYAVPDPYPCPGVQQGVFDFSGTLILDPLPACYFAQPGSSIFQVNNPMNGFQGTISFDGGVAALCVANPHAAISVGTHGVPPEEPWINVFYPDPGLALGTPVSVAGCNCPSTAAVKASACTCPPSSPTSNCSCTVLLIQNIVGTLISGSKGFTAFQGKMLNTVGFAANLPPELACDCLKSGPDDTTNPTVCSYSYQLTATSVGAR